MLKRAKYRTGDKQKAFGLIYLTPSNKRVLVSPSVSKFKKWIGSRKLDFETLSTGQHII